MNQRLYDPRRAWTLALAWFAFCWLLAAVSGGLAAVFTRPLATPAQLADPLWWGAWGLAISIILVAYGLIWPRGTFTDGRARRPVWQLGFGLAWGSSQGLLFLSLWHGLASAGLAPLAVYGFSYLAIGACNGVWHRFCWDIRVSPPHNYSEWNLRKVSLCHTPNLLVSLAALVAYGNAALFLLCQTLALLLSAWAMRFPAPGDDYRAVAGAERSLSS